MSKPKTYCDHCGEDITDKPCQLYSYLPFNVASANEGESAILCNPCYDIHTLWDADVVILKTRYSLTEEMSEALHRIIKMTGFPARDMIMNVVNEGIKEVLLGYSKNKKYAERFPKFFPDYNKATRIAANAARAAMEALRKEGKANS